MLEPGSHTSAAVSEWRHPASMEWLIAADLYDVFVAANTQRGKRPEYPRPWQVIKSRLGKATAPQNVIRAALRRIGHEKEAVTNG